MLKTILLLVLCIPMGRFAWNEAVRVSALWGVPPVLPDGESGSASVDPSSVDPLSDQTRVPPEVLAAFLSLSESPPRNPAGRLTQELLTFTRNRDLVARNDAVELARDNDNREKGKIEAERRRLIEGGKVRDRTNGADKIQELEKRLESYVKRPVFDAAFADEQLAATGLAKLELLDGPAELADAMNGLSEGGTENPPGSKDIQVHLDRIDGFLGNHGREPGPGASAEALDGVRKLRDGWVRLFRLAESVESDDPPGRIDALARQATEGGSTDGFQEAARRLALRYAGEYLGREPLDRDVFVVTDAAKGPERFDRAEVLIYWTEPSDVRVNKVPLGASPFNEFEISRDEVAYFAFPRGVGGVVKGQDARPLKPTPYSEVVTEYNRLRAEVPPEKWSEPFLRELLRHCEEHKDVLAAGGGKGSGGPTLIQRIQTMIDVVSDHSTIFRGP